MSLGLKEGRRRRKRRELEKGKGRRGRRWEGL